MAVGRRWPWLVDAQCVANKPGDLSLWPNRSFWGVLSLRRGRARRQAVGAIDEKLRTA